MSLHRRLSVTLGVWAAATLAPPATYGLLGPFEPGQAPLVVAIALGIGLAGSAVASLGIRRLSDSAARFRDGLPLAGLFALPGVVPLAAFPVAFVDGPIAAGPFVVGGVLGGIAAFGTGYVADSAVLARNRGELSVTFRARKRPASRIRRGIAAIAVAVAAAWAVLAALAGESLLVVVPVLLGLGQVPPLVRHWPSRRYTVTDAGLVRWSGHLPWAAVESYSLTAESLRIHTSVWPFGTIELDRNSIDDPDAVVAALETHLPRAEASLDEEPNVIDTIRKGLAS